MKFVREVLYEEKIVEQGVSIVKIRSAMVQLYLRTYMNFNSSFSTFRDRVW
jgi:hypothetical protein